MEEEKSLKCQECVEEFKSKKELFDHLTESGHQGNLALRTIPKVPKVEDDAGYEADQSLAMSSNSQRK